jgi:hypothetical protein
MTKFLATLAVAGAASLGLAGKADASPLSGVDVPVAARGSVGLGIGFGGGYGTHAYPSGYWATEYRTVPTTVFIGYDVQGRPLYETRYVQQAYQVWVPTVHYAPTYVRPTVSFGLGFGWGGRHRRHWR